MRRRRNARHYEAAEAHEDDVPGPGLSRHVDPSRQGPRTLPALFSGVSQGGSVMVTITLHDADAIEMLAHLKVITKAGNGDEKTDRVAAALSCALLLCDCDKAGKEKE